MKSKFKTVAILALLCGASQAAVTISGTTGTSFKTADGLTNIPAGILFMVLADAGTAGFLGTSANGAIVPGGSNGAALISANDPKVSVTDASITAGGFFGGDKIIATGATTSAGVIPTLLSSVSIAGFENKNFAVVWFTKSAATLGGQSSISGENYGILACADWTLPGTDAGNFTFSSTDAVPASNYFSIGTTVTAAQMGSIGFFTGAGIAGDAVADIKSATFSIVPEPSAALLGAIGVLGLLRRRRN